MILVFMGAARARPPALPEAGWRHLFSWESGAFPRKKVPPDFGALRAPKSRAALKIKNLPSGSG